MSDEETDPARTPLERDALDVNELARFTKTSTRLVLEHYSHCEVPAGCGGAVLRWRSPGGPVRIGARVHGPGWCREMIVDGEAAGGSQAEVLPGSRVVVLKLEFRDGCPADAAVRIAIGTSLSSVSRAGSVGEPFDVGSRADGSWQIATSEPLGPALTDARPGALWRVAERGHIEPPDAEHFSRWSWDACDAVRAEALTLPAGPGAIWVRTRLDVPSWEVADDD